MRMLPPLLLLGVLALVGARCALEPARLEARERITGLVQGADTEAAARALERYAARYRDPEDHWFRCASWFRLKQPKPAIDAIWGEPTLAAQPGTARRFAETALFALGWDAADRRDATPLEPLALLALSEGGNDWADARLRQHAATLDLMTFTPYFFAALRRATSPPMRTLVAALRERGGEKWPIAAAIGSESCLEPQAGPEREADLQALAGVIRDVEWRKQLRDVYAVAATALGRSRDPGAVATLREVADQLRSSASRRDQDDLPLLLNGLLASGDFDVEPELARLVFSADPPIKVVLSYVEALLTCYRRGDARPELRLRQLWEGPAARFGGLRARMARAILLHDAPPSPEARETFVDRMASDLERDEGPSVTRMVAAAWRLRAGQEGALERLLELMRLLGDAGGETPDPSLDTRTPFVEALRALYLYG